MFEGISLFDILTASEKSNLEIFCQERVLAPGEVLFNEGDEATSMYIVKSGLLEVYNSHAGVLGFVRAGEVVGEMALYDDITGGNKNRNASVKSLETTTLIVILNFSIKELTNKHPEILEKIKSVIESRKKR